MRRTMLTAVLAITTAGTLGGGCLGGRDAAPVKVRLEDGQVLYGQLRTDTLILDGALGRLRIPLADVGEVIPVEGEHLADAEGHVRVWLRNGSELVGRWDDPELAMSIAVGDGEVRVDLPPEQLQRLQTRGGELWPDTAVYRVRTTHGDDFLVDAEASRIAIHSDLGTFEPYLAECSSIRPLDGPRGEWRVELATGTVLVGQPVNDEIVLSMSLGPDEVTVPLAALESMEQQTWYAFAEAPGSDSRRAVGSHGRRPGGLLGGLGRGGEAGVASVPAEADDAGSWTGWDAAEEEGAAPPVAVPPAAEPGVTDDASGGDDGWFRRDALEQSKSAAR